LESCPGSFEDGSDGTESGLAEALVQLQVKKWWRAAEFFGRGRGEQLQIEKCKIQVRRRDGSRKGAKTQRIDGPVALAQPGTVPWA
jgi:hypothetical protein